MKKILPIALVALALFSCDNKAKQEAEQAQALAAATHQELVQAVQERDELLDLINEIAGTTGEIKDIEQIVSINANGGEAVSNKSKVQSDLSAIKATLDQRRKRIEELEAALRNSKTSNSKLLTTIETLKKQVSDQMTEIETLSSQLYAANQQIAKLDQAVDSLSTQVQETSSRLSEATQENTRLDNEMNTVYYAIGTKNELKEHNIIEGGGFLRKSKVMQGEFDKTFFAQADKRSLTVLPLHSKKAKIITKYQPAGSYQLVEEDGQMVLHITNPNEFWGVSNFLVIQID